MESWNGHSGISVDFILVHQNVHAKIQKMFVEPAYHKGAPSFSMEVQAGIHFSLMLCP